MLKKVSEYCFKKPDEIGLDNYLVLIFCFLTAFLGVIGTIINICLHLGWFTIICTAGVTALFSLVYYYSWKKGKYVVSKYIIIILGIILLNVQWFINFGSSGPILYMFVVIESFIIVFFSKREKRVFTIFVLLNVTLLFYIEYRFPATIGKYANDTTRLVDVYTGLLIYLFLSILLLNIALKFYAKEREKALLADKFKSAFLANMSHEIRTPMNGILGFAELLKQSDLTSAERKEFIDVILKSGERMLNIINDIIDISKVESGLMKTNIKESDINEQIAYIYTFFKPEVDEKGLELSFTNGLPSNEAIIKTDHEKLYAILLNLVKNAIKNTDKGTIEFGYTRKTDRQPAVLLFFVKDTGIGIPADRQEAIFERFVQADISDKKAFKGAGLGLSISKAYVEMLGGTISVESEPGKGTVFYFTIPYENGIMERPAVKNIIPISDEMDKIGNLKILIVEDDHTSEILLTREVNKICRELLKVKTGADAVETCRYHQDIDLVLMDIRLPGMNGYEAARQIRKFNNKVVIIAQTAYGLSGDKEKSIEAGCNDYISKPIHTGSLILLIQKYFKSSQLFPEVKHHELS